MRILLTSHVPLEDADSPWSLRQLAGGLQAAGHEPRCLIVDTSGDGDQPFAVRRVLCGAADADLPCRLPCFSAERTQRMQFSELTDTQLGQYRECLRCALDKQVEQFNPHLIHADSVWIWGHLALETGAPYVLSASSAELEACQTDPRFARFANEAAENAGRIFAADETVQMAVLAAFNVPEAKVLALDTRSIEEIARVYSQVLSERFGGEPGW